MRKINKFILIFVISLIIGFLIPGKVQAAGSFSTNKTSVSLTTGDITTITVTASGCAGKFNISSSNTNVATVSTSSVFLDSSSETITITSKMAGTATITITAADVTDTELNDITGSKTCSIKVADPEPVKPVEPEKPAEQPKPQNNTKPSTNTTPKTPTTVVTKSSNSKLAKLEVAEGLINPEFSSSISEYNLTVTNEVTKLSIAAIPDSSKATVTITGNEELQVGSNEIQIVVTAEDGSKTTYKIVATRKEPELCVQTLNIYYINENGEKVPVILKPIFSFDNYEYSVEEILPHTVKEVFVEATSNRDVAKIEITGNDKIVAGKNEIVIDAKITEQTVIPTETTEKNEDIENVEALENIIEQKKYTITLEREEEPVIINLTTMDKIKNWFSGVGTGIGKWIADNLNNITTGMLIVATTAFVGLTFYFAYDYKNYQKVLAKLAEINKENLMERANVALDVEIANKNLEKMQEDSIEENIEKQEIKQTETEVDNLAIDNSDPIYRDRRAKKANGKRFK